MKKKCVIGFLSFIFRMPYQDGFIQVFGDRLTQLSHRTTKEQIKHTYDNWASVYDKVTTICMILILVVLLSILYYQTGKDVKDIQDYMQEN